MSKLTADMIRVVEEQKIGYVATVNPDGTPNLSPKGTFIVLDESHLMFGEIRSPNTIKNLSHSPIVEINFVDIFSRRGFRCRGNARLVREFDDEFEKLMPPFRIQWGDELCSLFHGIVIIEIESAANLISPAYDIGSKENELRQHWLSYFSGLQPDPGKPAQRLDTET